MELERGKKYESSATGRKAVETAQTDKTKKNKLLKINIHRRWLTVETVQTNDATNKRQTGNIIDARGPAGEGKILPLQRRNRHSRVNSAKNKTRTGWTRRAFARTVPTGQKLNSEKKC